MTLAGCPLEERISEFHKLRAEGWPLGALAMICVDNPMVAATGHRICNDCMKSCIYQKQEPVDIPQSETRMLKDVLALPWGFEIYWPADALESAEPAPPAAAKRRPASACWSSGMGPAGFTLAHHLLNDGHTVVGDRRPQDRAAAAGAFRCDRDRRARAVRADTRRRRCCASRSTSA